jgi:addiction module RelB/DinJ family antitoxin
MATNTTFFRARVPKKRYVNTEKIFARLGLKPADAFNLFLAQVELREDLPFAVTAHPANLLTADAQATAWNDSLGEY